MYSYIWYNYLENFKVSEFKEEYNNLNNSINSDNSKLISFLIFGILLGRIVEKYKNIKKRIRRKK